MAAARRLAWVVRHDPIAGELTRYAEGLMAKAMGVEAEFRQTTGRSGAAVSEARDEQHDKPASMAMDMER